jgi:MFS transporter, ACS family, hexuronate transporter
VQKPALLLRAYICAINAQRPPPLQFDFSALITMNSRTASHTATAPWSAVLYRNKWTICALLFVATTNNYMDRQIFGLLAPTLQKAIGWSELDYGYIITAFQAAYAFGQLFIGGVLDRIGTRIGLAAIVSGWSLASIAHAFVNTAFGFGAARFFLGATEAGMFPAGVKTVSEWFPKRQRALATGIFNAGTNVGAVLTPLLIPWITIQFGWRWAFAVTALTGVIFLIFWLWIYPPGRAHSGEAQSQAGGHQRWVTFLQIARTRQGWAYALGKFFCDPIWWFHLYWLPKFLNAHYGLTLDKIGLPLVVVYLAADAGCVGFGWFSGWLITRGWSTNLARKTTMLICALLIVPVIFATSASNLWAAVALISLAVSAHQGYSTNLFTLTTDLFPKNLIGSAMGFGGAAGAIGGMFIATFAGYILQVTGSYVPLFIVAGTAYLVGLLLIHLLSPRLNPVAGYDERPGID